MYKAFIHAALGAFALSLFLAPSHVASPSDATANHEQRSMWAMVVDGESKHIVALSDATEEAGVRLLWGWILRGPYAQESK